MTEEIYAERPTEGAAERPPGWYPDRGNPGVTRWWNGTTWGRTKGRLNRVALAAFAFAWALPIGGPPAVVLGVMAIQEINDFDRAERGKGIAVWAILIGVLNIALVAAGATMAIVALTKHGHHAAGGSLGCARWEELEGFC